MKKTRIMMDMPITIEIIDDGAEQSTFQKVFEYFQYVDDTFSIYKKTSEISLIYPSYAGLPSSAWSKQLRGSYTGVNSFMSRIHEKKISQKNWSYDMKEIFSLCEKTKQETNGYFDIQKNGKTDPSGMVKGWAIWKASKLIASLGFKNYFVDAGGDIQVAGHNSQGKKWKIGIRNPFNRKEIVQSVFVDTQGIATSGTYIRGQHIYDPHHPEKKISDIVSLTIIGPNILEADRFATAAFAMGKEGIYFIEKRQGLEGYVIDSKGIATWTSGFEKYIVE